MPLERIPGDVAIERHNLVARWPKRDGGENRVEPIAKPVFRPGFKLQPGDSIFTIGSCFARNVERELVKRGFDIPAWRVLKQDEDEFTKFGPNILNNYSVASIYNEVAWALD